MKKYLLVTLTFYCFISQANDFTWHYYQQAAKSSKDNINFSPISLKMALHLAYLGTDGDTKAFFEKTFSFKDRAAFKKEFQSMEAINKNQKAYGQLQIANSVWLRDIKQIETSYLSEIKNQNAITGPIDAVKMNDWVKKATKGKITNLFDADQVKKYFAILVNAIYFKADWENTFDKSSTREKSFYSAPKTPSKVQMMQMEHHFQYVEDNQTQMVRLPYQGNHFSLYLLLPKKTFALSALEKNLNEKYWQKLQSQMKATIIDLSLPKFKFERKVSMKNDLKAMGLQQLFASGNYSKLSKTDGLQISDIIQASSITVDEKGTEAAAATAIYVLEGAPEPKQKVVFNADQPFMFILKNETTQEIYFMGRMVKF